jgi:putative DNA primase/helicase
MNDTLDNRVKSFNELDDKFYTEVKVIEQRLTDDPSYLQENYVMLHGTDCVWEKQTGKMISCKNMALSFPEGFKIWKSNAAREIIPIEDLVFSPEGCKKGQINMFTGLKNKPKKGNVDEWLFHIKNVICGGDIEGFEWLMKWLAYPLQNIGSKMATSIVVHGDEGAGKNLVFEPLLEIYDGWSKMVNQSNVESEFNDWISCKLFIIANEVLSRREKKHIKGKIKSWITENTIQIRRMFLGFRTERNCANLMFFSNEDSPVDTDESDRRYMVFKTDNAFISEPASWYKELAESIDASAIHYYLLHEVDCSDFSPHTKPLMTKAKKDLLHSNMPSHTIFINDWINGETIFPASNIVGATQLYWAYQCWCAENGERFPCTATTFGRALASKKTLAKGYPSIRFSSKKITAYFVDTPVISTIEQETITNFDNLVDEQKRKYHL